MWVKQKIQNTFYRYNKPRESDGEFCRNFHRTILEDSKKIFKC